MRVKRLEVYGFKSFKDKTVIHFDKKVTGVVGPNGCGKSNIVDAFFWVMGEQSYKHMRGKGSDDLIFNGSSKYSPLGMAEATLVMETNVVDPEEAPSGATVRDIPLSLKSKEISVTRRVYRGGEGEYFINSVPARLRDIHELFMDTGVGTKGYSVIEQGQIGKIVNAKPEERRILIEEAAGIAKYKARKKESLRKIAATEANLERINDVLKEIQRNLNSLERQAQKAKKYREYKNELLEKEITWGRKKLALTKKKNDEFKKEKEILELDVAGLRSEVQRSENQIELDRTEQLTDTKSAEELQTQIEKLAHDLAKDESALELSKRRQEDLEKQIESFSNEKIESFESISIEKQEIEKLVSGLDRLRLNLRSVESELSEKENEVKQRRDEANGARNILDSTRQKLLRGSQEETQLRTNLAAGEAKIESIESQINKIIDAITETDNELSRIHSENSILKIQAEELENQMNSQKHKLEIQKSDLNKKNSCLNEFEALQIEALEAFAQVESKLTNLKELDAAREGLGSGPKSVLEWAEKKGLSHQFGAIADLLQVKVGYERALEAWLGEALGGLYSKEIVSASDALAQLREQNKGKAGIFLPVDESHFEMDLESRNEIEALGIKVQGALVDFVQSKNPDISIDQLLGGVWVISAFEESKLSELLEISKKQGCSIISQDGIALLSLGYLRGGVTESDQDSSLLGRKRAIQELEISWDEKHKNKIEIEAELKSLKKIIVETDREISLKESSLQQLEIDYAKKTGDLERQNKYVNEITQRADNVREEKSSLIAERETIIRSLDGIEEKIDGFESIKTQLESNLSTEESKLTETEVELQSKEETLSKIKINEASMKERLQGLEKEIDAIRRQLENREKRLNEVIEFLEIASNQKEEHFGGDSEIQSRIDEFNRMLRVKKLNLSEIKDRLEISNSKISDALELMKGSRDQVDSKSNQINEIAVDIEKVQAAWNHIVQNLEEKYGPGCLDKIQVESQEEFIEPVVTQNMSEEDEKILHEDIDKLRERIRRIGEVNTMAIEEYDELKKRFDHIDQERQDLEKSIENLLAAIEHINLTSEDRFQKAFDAISDRFKHLFPIIFGGGRAELTLVYPEGVTDVLESGIDILAQPPGKKIVNISLLSGGEKALTAVSLIFAIFMVKPSPFCILDEVDAPLDDANIGRFNALLKEMAAKTQFILITHNKKTMELNDTLYGVTMEEPGVSKMVSIELQ